MDSFYGNMVNLLNAQFQFDKFYPNKKAMDAAANTDDVFTGRHVLIEYDQEPENYFEKEENDFKSVYYPSRDEIETFVNANHGEMYDHLFMDGKTAYFADENYTQLYVLNYENPVVKNNYIDQYCEISYGTGKVRVFIDEGGSLNKITINKNNKNEVLVLYDNDIIYNFNEINPKNYSGNSNIKCIVGHDINITDNKFYIISYIKNNEGWDINIVDSITADTIFRNPKAGYNDTLYSFKTINIGSTIYNKDSKEIGIVYKEPEEIFIEAMGDEPELFIKFYYELTNEYDTDYTIIGDKDKKIIEKGPLHYKQLVNDTFDSNKDYYFCMPIANFEITKFEIGENNRKLNEIIDNVFTNEKHIYNFDNTFNYDLTIWRKGHELISGKSEDKYREITGYKVPKLDYNLSPDTVLTATPDNKIKGKKLEGSGKIAVNFGQDEVVVSHEKSNNIVNNLGVEGLEIKSLNFPNKGRTWRDTIDETKINAYLTSTIKIFPPIGGVNYYKLNNIVVWISVNQFKHTITYTNNDGEEITEEIISNYIGEALVEKKQEGQEAPVYGPIKDGENKYRIFITNSTASYNKSTNQISFDVKEQDKGSKGILYDARIGEAFIIPYLEIDDYGHAIKTRNTQFILPVVDLENNEITYHLDDTIVNFARQSGLATNLADTIQFTIGNTTRSGSEYTWTFEDMGFATEEDLFVKNSESEAEKPKFYPIATKLRNPISITIGNKELETDGSNPLIFTAEDIGFIRRKGDSGIDSLTFKPNSTLSFGNSILSDEGIQATNGYKIEVKNEGNNKVAFEMDNAGAASINLNKIVLTNAVYGKTLPTEGITEGQIFFLIEETTTNTNN